MERSNEWKGNNKQVKFREISDSNVENNILGRRNKQKGYIKQCKSGLISDRNVDQDIMGRTNDWISKMNRINLGRSAIEMLIKI